jgi:Ran GTPase-activating protein (RanGAP) involved in mRNA processing and transport
MSEPRNQTAWAGWVILSNIIANNEDPLITTLNLSGRGIPLTIDFSGYMIAKALRTNTTLTSLDVSGNDMNTGILTLCGILSVNTTLTCVNLSYTQIRDEGAHALAGVMTSNTSITTLDIGGNYISCVGIKSVAEALATNTSLTQIDLYINHFGTEGALCLAGALSVNTSLTSVGVDGNSDIGLKGVLALAQALTMNTTIQHFDMTGNCVRDEGLVALADAMTINTSIVNLKFNLLTSTQFVRPNSPFTQVGRDARCRITECCERNIMLKSLGTLR